MIQNLIQCVQGGHTGHRAVYWGINHKETHTSTKNNGQARLKKSCQKETVREKLTLSALKVSMNFSNSSGGRKSPIKCFPFPMSVRDSAHSGKKK